MSDYRSSGPSPLLIILIGALVVFGGYYVWLGMLRFFEDQGNITAQVTRQAVTTSTARAAPAGLPTIPSFATYTPLPPCQWFEVSVERARYRECPSEDNDLCPSRDSLTYGTRVCVYERSPDNPAWYVVELNPEGAFRDIVYMHESVIDALNPTNTPAPSHTPLPTITPTPSPTRGPTDTPSPFLSPTPSDTPDADAPTGSPTPSPTRTPPPTPFEVII